MECPAPDAPTGRLTPVLAADEVHVWTIPLDLDTTAAAAASRWLSAEERERAGQFRFPRLRERFTAGRAAMRLLLGGYLGVDAAQLEFSYGRRGKPSLPNSGIEFNLAHSDDLALLAVTRAAAVGVDVERIRPMPDGLSIARRFFAASEVAAFETVPATARDEAFFNLWSRKEAWLKATGDGISESLARVEFAFRPGDEARILAIGGDADAAAAWSLFAWQPAPGFTAALALPARGVKLACQRFSISSASEAHGARLMR